MNYRLYIGGRFLESDTNETIKNPYNGREIANVSCATKEDLAEAIEVSFKAMDKLSAIGLSKKIKVLQILYNEMLKQKKEIIKTIVFESGKPVSAATQEFYHSINLLKDAISISIGMQDDIPKMQINPFLERAKAFAERQASGIIVSIGFFDFPLLFVIKAISLSIIIGAPLIIIPPIQTPITTMLIAQILFSLPYPRESISVLPFKELSDDIVSMFNTQEIAGIIIKSDKQSVDRVKRLCYNKHVFNETGGMLGAIVHNDAILEDAANMCIKAAFKNQGNIDIALNVMYVQSDVYHQFLGKFVKKANLLSIGNPASKESEILAIPDEGYIKLIEDWVARAENKGVDIVSGGYRNGNIFLPTVALEVPSDLLQEMPGLNFPIVSLNSYDTIEEVIDNIQELKAITHLAFFTQNISRILATFERININYISVNHVPFFKVLDFHESGLNYIDYESLALKSLIESFSKIKVLTINPVGYD